MSSHQVSCGRACAHSNVDRNNMMWAVNLASVGLGVKYPTLRTDVSGVIGSPPYGTSGPYGTYDLL
eukprot:6207802-Pleurochrysis_carterae.AAC.1